MSEQGDRQGSARGLAGGRARRPATGWLALPVPTAGIAVPVWVAVTARGAVVHGHPLYAVLLAATVVAAALALVVGLRTLRRSAARRSPPLGRRALRMLAAAATGAFEDTRADLPGVRRWVVGGHSLGGGDGIPAISHDAAPEEVSAATVALVDARSP